MKRSAAVTILLLLLTYFAKASHISGGEIFYEYRGAGSSPNTDKFLITLRLFRDAFAQEGMERVADMPTSVTLSIFTKNGSNYTRYQDVTPVRRTRMNTIALTPGAYPCVLSPPRISYEVGYFELEIDLPRESDGYVVAFQTCCRAAGITNMVGQQVPGGNLTDGATYVATISGTSALGSAPNSSPQFYLKDTALVCANTPFILDFGASDPDKDSLSFSFCSAYDRGEAIDASVNYIPIPPPYKSITYTSGFSGSMPLGTDVSIDSKTGLITGVAPKQGKYVINVCIDEWRKGVRIGSHRKDFILEVRSCVTAGAALQPEYLNCDDLTVSFENLKGSPLIKTWNWEFGTPGGTSTLEKPVYTFPAAGEYPVKLVVNKNGECPDSASTTVKVFPGFFPDFEINGRCILNDFSFTDRSTTAYGSVTKWNWNFGDETTTIDVSDLPNPTWKYSTTGLKQVECTVENSVGCSKKVVAKDVLVIERPEISLPFRDTLICSIDTLKLSATGMGLFSWTPDIITISRFNNTPQPEVFPKVTTTFKLTLNDEGCTNTDSVLVRVVDDVTLDAGDPTTICLTDPVTLNPTGDGLYFEWTPAATLDDPFKKNAVAIPTAPTTTYRVTARISDKCFTTDEVVVHTVPYPISNAGNDVIICYEDTTQLTASMDGTSFTWTPDNTLLDANTLSPQAFPLRTTSYILKVWDTKGCPKPGIDTVTVVVRPQINANAGNDTSIVAGQPLQLNGSGSQFYEWTPSTGLNNPYIKTPVATLQDNITYVMKTFTEEGCQALDTVNVKVFKARPDIFVPNAFTPGKGSNALFRSIPFGIASLQSFRVFNRWGQQVYSNTDSSRGWDGRFRGKEQPQGTYVWMASGIDYTGKPIVKKGTVLLIR